MPIYPHRCPDCGHEEDLIRNISDRRAPASCPCGQIMERIEMNLTAAGEPGHYTKLIMPSGERIAAGDGKRRST